MPELYLHYRCFFKTNNDIIITMIIQHKGCFSEFNIFPSIANFDNLENPDNFANLANLGNPKNHFFCLSAVFLWGNKSLEFQLFVKELQRQKENMKMKEKGRVEDCTSSQR